MTEQPPRANRTGHPCPPWCVTDHASSSVHSAGPVYIRMPSAVEGFQDGIRARAVQLPHELEQAQVAVGASRWGQDPGQDPTLWLGPQDAAGLAVIVEMLAAATADQHRELAAAIRKAAADITGEDGVPGE